MASSKTPVEGSKFSRFVTAALGGGIPGAIAMVLNVFLLMWLRTTVNYQYKTGKSMGEAFADLYAQGGIGRFYQGLLPALFQGPLSRFGDTAANEGVKELLRDSGLSLGAITFAAAVAAGGWRIVISPIDTIKTTMQVHGSEGMSQLTAKIAGHGPLVLFAGSLAAWAASVVGYFPWYATFNKLDSIIPQQRGVKKHVRSAGMGLCSSLVADTISNSIRVVKIVAQTSEVPLSYVGAASKVIAEDGLQGLFFRGLPTKLLANGIQSILFTILWRALMEKMKARAAARALLPSAAVPAAGMGPPPFSAAWFRRPLPTFLILVCGVVLLRQLALTTVFSAGEAADVALHV